MVHSQCATQTKPARALESPEHAPQNKLGWRLAVEVLSVGRAALHRSSHVVQLPSYCSCLGRSEQRSDACLSNALADQSSNILPLNMPFAKLARHGTPHSDPVHCKHATQRDRLRYASKRALQNRLGWPLAFSGQAEQRSAARLSQPRLQTDFKTCRVAREPFWVDLTSYRPCCPSKATGSRL